MLDLFLEGRIITKRDDGCYFRVYIDHRNDNDNKMIVAIYSPYTENHFEEVVDEESNLDFSEVMEWLKSRQDY